MTENRIARLEAIGFKRWTKGNMDRLYINASQLGLICDYYNTGNVKNAEFRGEHVSNCEARRMKAAKTFIDIKTDTVHSDSPTLQKAAQELFDANEEPDESYEDDEEHYCPSSSAGDYGPSNPWDAPGMKISDFIDVPVYYN